MYCLLPLNSAHWVENVASQNCLNLAKFSRDHVPHEIITVLCHTQEKYSENESPTYSFVQNSSYKMENRAAGSVAKSCRTSTQRLSSWAGQPMEDTGVRAWTNAWICSFQQWGGKKKSVFASEQGRIAKKGERVHGKKVLHTNYWQ